MDKYFTGMKIMNFLIRGMIFENYKSVPSMDKYFTEMKIINFRIYDN